MRAEQLRDLLVQRHRRDVFVTECKTGPSRKAAFCPRLDAWAMTKSWANPCVTGYEIKVARSDFLNDDKWPMYLPFCNEFYFVTPPGIVKEGEIPPQAGWLVSMKNGTKVYRKKKAPWRDVQIPEEIFRYILFSRTEVVGEYEPKENRAGYWRRWLKEKEKDRELGYEVSRRVQELYKENVLEVRTKQKWIEAEMEKLAEVKALMAELGIDVRNSWNLRRTVLQKLSGVGDGRTLSTMRRLSENLLKMEKELQELGVGAEEEEIAEMVRHFVGGNGTEGQGQ